MSVSGNQWIGPVTSLQVFDYATGQTAPPAFDSSKSIGAGEVFEVVQSVTPNYATPAEYNHARVLTYYDTPTTDINFTGSQIACANLALAGGGDLANSDKDVIFTGKGGIATPVTLVAYGFGADGRPKQIWIPRFTAGQKNTIKPDFKASSWTMPGVAELDDTVAYTDGVSTWNQITSALIDYPAAGPATLTATFSPTDGATGQTTTVVPLITFSAALDGASLNPGNFVLVRQDTKGIVATTATFQDADHKIVQINHVAALASSTKTYQLVIPPGRVVSLAGDVYAGSETTFVTT